MNPAKARPCREFSSLRIENLMFNRRNIAVNIQTRAAGVDPIWRDGFSLCFHIRAMTQDQVVDALIECGEQFAMPNVHRA